MAANGTNMDTFLNGLGVASSPDTTTIPPNPGGSPQPDAKQPGNDVVHTAPNKQAGSVPAESKNALTIVQGVASGHLAGVMVDRDCKIPDEFLGKTVQNKVDTLAKMGVGVFRPTSDTRGIVLYNYRQVPQSTLKAMDKKDVLHKAFPSLTKLMSGGETDKGKSNAPTEEAPNFMGTNPPGHDNPSISDMNLTGAPPPHAPQVVPVLPKPSFSGDAQKQLLAARMKAANGQGPNTAPGSLRPNSIINGLFAQTT